jgi:hypothetical protein
MSFEPIRIGNTVIRRINKSASMYEITNAASPHLLKSIDKSYSTAFEATDVLTMRSYLKRNRHATELYVALRLVHDLGAQMQALISAGRSIACFGVDDVVVITHRASDKFVHDVINDLDSTLDDNRMDPQFLFLNDRLIFEVDESDGALLIDRALPSANTSAAFLSPELLDPKPLDPLDVSVRSVHFKTAYYSVAQLVIHFLLNVIIDSGPADDELLQPIKGTKLHWFLLRCLNRVPSERKYVYI